MKILINKKLALLLLFFNIYTDLSAKKSPSNKTHKYITAHNRSSQSSIKQNKSSEYITVAILAKDKAQCLDLYLDCLERQTWPANKTYLYIRTNNNTDETAEILRNWIARVGKNYAKIYFDDSNVPERVEEFKQHEWNYLRLKVISALRQESVDWAIANKSHYFIADCDNFIFPDTIESLLRTNLPIVGPLLRCSGHDSTLECSNPYYSNYHYAIDENGYYSHSPLYYNVLYQEIKGLIEVPVIHCTYLIRREVLDKIYYDDNSARYEYVILSDSARKQNIPQYIDNRKIYGYLTFADTKEDFHQEPFLKAFALPKTK